MKTSAAATKISPLITGFFDAPLSVRELFAVSAQSLWGDDVWYLETRTAGVTRSGCCYRWTGLSNPSHLIEDCKLFVWSTHHENFRGRALKTTSANSRALYVRRFLRWLNHVGIENLSDLPPGFGFQYLSYLLDQPGAARLRNRTIGQMLDVTVHMFQQAQVMRAAGRDAITSHPLNGQNPYKLAKDCGQEGGTIPSVPDELFVRTAEAACLWIDRNSVDLIRLLADSVAARTTGPKQYETWRAYDVNRALKGARFDATGFEWREMLGDQASSELGDLLKDLRAASAIAIQAFAGIRINEVLALEAEPRDERTGWPACLSVKPSRDGVMDVFYICGRLAKGQDDYIDVEWVAGARPAGSNHLPPPVRALLVLEELFRPWRVNGITRLMLTGSAGKGLPDNLPMRPCSYRVAAHDQVRFIARHIYACDTELAKRVDWWRVSTHQWRKSFAQFVVRSDERLLRAVSEHFKHVSLAMTSEGYVGNDVELLGLIDDEALNRVAAVTMQAISGELAVAGPLAELIERQRERILEEVGTGTLDEQTAALRDMLKDDNVRSWSCGWGDCFFRPETARCHAEALGTYSLSARKPNAETRRPEVCCDCANLVVLPEHRPYWDRRRERNQLIVEADPDIQSSSTRVAQVRVEQAQRILRRLDVAQERINAKKAVAA